MSPLLRRVESAARPRDERVQFAYHKGKSAHISISSARRNQKSLFSSPESREIGRRFSGSRNRARCLDSGGGVAHKKSSQTIKSFICAVPQSGCLAGQR